MDAVGPRRRGVKRAPDTVLTPTSDESEEPLPSVLVSVALLAIEAEAPTTTSLARLRTWHGALVGLQSKTKAVLKMVQARDRAIVKARALAREVGNFVAQLVAMRPGAAVATLNEDLLKAVGEPQLRRVGASAHKVQVRVHRAEFKKLFDEDDGEARVGMFCRDEGKVKVVTPLPPALQLHSKAVQSAVAKLVKCTYTQTLYDASRSGVQVVFDPDPEHRRGWATFHVDVTIVLRTAVCG